MRVVEPDRLAEELHVALRVIHAHDAVRNADLALTGQAADAEDLALADVQGDVLDLLARHVHRQMADLERDRRILRELARVGGDESGLALASDHHLRQLGHVGVCRARLADELAVAQDGHAVRRRDHLVQAVGDEDDGDALGGNALHHAQQLRRLGLGQNRRRLVEHQQLHARLVDLAGDLDKLHVADRQTLDQRIFINGHAHAVQRLAGVLRHGGHIQRFQILAKDAGEQTRMGDFAVELDVFGDGEARQQHELLVNHADALEHRVVRRGDRRRLTIDQHFALEAAGRMNDGHAKEHVHQRALACAVFAQKRMDFAGPDFEGDVGQHLVFAVALGDVFHLQNVLRGQMYSSLMKLKSDPPHQKRRVSLFYAIFGLGRLITRDNR